MFSVKTGSHYLYSVFIIIGTSKSFNGNLDIVISSDEVNLDLGKVAL